MVKFQFSENWSSSPLAGPGKWGAILAAPAEHPANEQRFPNRHIDGGLAAGLAGGLAAAVALSLLDWWLLLRQGGRAVDAETLAVLAYAFIFLGAAGACCGLGLAVSGMALKPLGARPPGVLTTGVIALTLGVLPLVRVGWMPHWNRSATAGRAFGGWWLISLVVLAALLVALLPRALRRLRGAGRVARGPRDRALALVLCGLYLAAGAGWWLGRPTVEDVVKRWEAPTVAAVNRRDPDRGAAVGGGGPPVVILLLDTLRWDALSCYGNDERLTPNLDRFSREAVQFETVRAQASWTKPSIATLLTSTHPRQHGARGRADRIRSGVPSLAGLFRRSGYRTGAVVANGNISPAFGFARGFEAYLYLRPDFALGARGQALGLGTYRIASALWQRLASGSRDHRHFKRDAGEVNAAVLAWLGEAHAGDRRPPFLFVNYIDPHDPYFRHPYDGRALGAVDGKSPPAGRRGEMASLYDGEVAFLDRHLGRLFARLRQLGLYDRSVIVVTSDHGEEFLDHGGWWHGLTLYEEQVRVPLLVRLPGGAGGGNLAVEAAGLIDVGPGVLELAGLGDRIPERMSGRSLARWLPGGEGGKDGAARPFTADETLDGNDLASLTEGRWKYVRANPGNRRGLPENSLFDVVSDPEERVNMAAARPELVAAMSRRLDKLLGSGRETPAAGPNIELDAETEEHLRALGYLH